jgi:hypothetical protein
MSKFICYICCAFGIIILFCLELKYSRNLEGSNRDKTFIINSKKLKENPFKEIYRYIDDTCFYNNIWRISLLAALIFIFMILPFINKNLTYLPYLIIVLFAVIYHSLQWKLTHTYHFIFKSVKHTLQHLENNTADTYKPLTHYNFMIDEDSHL